MHEEIDAWVVGGCVRHCWILHSTCNGQPQLTSYLGGLPSEASPPPLAHGHQLFWRLCATFTFHNCMNTSTHHNHRSRRCVSRIIIRTKELQMASVSGNTQSSCSHTFANLALHTVFSGIISHTRRLSLENCIFHHRRLVALFITTAARGKERWCITHVR